MKKFIVIFLLMFLPDPAGFFAAQQEKREEGLRLSTPDELKADIESVPCTDGDRIAAVKALFEKMGADPERITVERFKKTENVVIRKSGKSPDGPEEFDKKIVIGAHYDKAEKGCGVIDNWTGIVAIAHIYRTLKDSLPNKTLVFVAFGQEERGLVGSKSMVGSIKKEERAGYCAMVNVDSLGLGAPQVADNMSSGKKMINLATQVAKELDIPFTHSRLSGGDSDSTSFVWIRVPALTIHTLNGRWRDIIHTNNDQVPKVDIQSVHQGYRLALALVLRLDQAACQAYR